MNKETKLDIIEISRGYVRAILLAILMYTGVVGAMYAGESISFETNLTNPVYTITNNQSSMEGLKVYFNNSNITITTVSNFKPDNFTIIIFDNITNEVIKEVSVGSGSSGGHSSRIKYIDNNVTVYVPEYINNTKEVEVEKIVPTNDTTILENGFKLWHILLAMLIGGLFTWYIISKENKEEQ